MVKGRPVNAVVAKTPDSSHDAAKESNLPSRGLPGPASFEVSSVIRGYRDLQGFSADNSS